MPRRLFPTEHEAVVLHLTPTEAAQARRRAATVGLDLTDYLHSVAILGMTTRSGVPTSPVRDAASASA